VPVVLRIFVVLALVPGTLSADSGRASDRAGQMTEPNLATELMRERLARLRQIRARDRSQELGPWVLMNEWDWWWDADADDTDPPDPGSTQ